MLVQEALYLLLFQFQIQILREYLFLGLSSDENDISCFNIVGCPVAPSDAHYSVNPHIHFRLKNKGGSGAVRELCDLVCKKLGYL